MRETKQRVKIGVAIHQPLRDQLFTRADQKRLESLGDVTWAEQTRPLTWDETASLLHDCEIALGGWGTPPLGAALLEACPRLELWEHVAGSVKHLFGPHLDGRAVTIASCKPALADVVAEMTLGEIILGLRGVFENAAGNRRRVVPQPSHSRVLMGSTIGIVGASLIGRRVIDLLRPFGCDILVYDPYLSDREAAAMDVERVGDLPALCARCDVVSLHTPDVPETAGIMGAAEFAAMRDDTVFINTARGRCVDEGALIAELSQGRLLAILDVSEPEPPAPDSPLRSLPNVVYTSHIGGPACPNLGRQAVDDIEAYLSGGSPQYVVTPEMLAIIA